MTGQSKVELILELKNRMKTGLSRAKQSVNSTVSDMKGKFNDFKLNAVRNIKSVASEVPLIGRAFQLIRNPIVMATATLVSIGALIGSTTAKAAEFEHAFLPIKQLNLDKSSQQLASYQDKIKKAAFEVGTNLQDSTKAMYDLQSATGLYGDKAIDIFKKVGNYSIATGANLGDAMNSTTKAMKAFGLEVKDIDALLESNAKTVQVGITTFDELARVQTEYAGAASSAGQGVNEANKVFAMFTSIAKNSDVGATMTKTFFQGLSQQAGKIKKELGIKVFDNGEMRKADDILKDIAEKFQSMNKEQISNTINAIGGPEGLRGALDKVSTGAKDMIQTFESFDSSKFSLTEALKNAKKDATVLSQIAQNRKGILMVEIGQKFLPIWVTILEKVNDLLGFVWDNFDMIWAVVKNVTIGLGLAKAAMIIFNIITAANPIGAIVTAVSLLIAYITIAYKKFDQFGALMLKVLGPLGTILSIVFNIKKHWDSIVSAFTEGGFLAGIKQVGLVIIDALVMPVQQLLKLLGEIPGLDIVGEWADDVARWRKNVLGIDTSPAEQDKEEEEEQQGKKLFGNKFAYPEGELANSAINGITGSAKQVKNITVNIGALHEGDINTANSDMEQMNAHELEEFFNNLLLRTIRNVELSY